MAADQVAGCSSLSSMPRPTLRLALFMSSKARVGEAVALESMVEISSGIIDIWQQLYPTHFVLGLSPWSKVLVNLLCICWCMKLLHEEDRQNLITSFLKALVRACPFAAQARVDPDETILQLCVKYNQVGALELLVGKPELQQLVNAKDADGSTFFHLAVSVRNFELPIMNMNRRLCEAALSKESAASLSEIHDEDTANLVMSYLNASPLHLAALHGNLEFVKRVVHQIPQLAEAIDSRRRTPLHLACAEGHMDIVKELVSAKVDMCISRDLDGRNPLHVAVVKGKVNVLAELLVACPLAARERVDRDQTILHLCVMHNQLQALKLMLKDPKLLELVNAKDADGNTVLHLAVADTNFEIVKALYGVKKIHRNLKNTNGYTALDMLPEEVETCTSDLKDFIHKGGVKSAKDFKREEWLAKRKDSIMVVAALIATVAFQVAMSPPGGVWQDNSDEHKAGEIIMAYSVPQAYPLFIRFNTLAFLGAVTTILFLTSDTGLNSWIQISTLVITLSIAVVGMACTYAISIVVLTPNQSRKSVSKPIGTGIITWVVVITVGIYLLALAKSGRQFVENYKAKKRMTRLEHTTLNLRPDGTV